mgnify:CR=1 FL=1
MPTLDERINNRKNKKINKYKKFTQEELRGCVNFSLFCQKILQELSCIFLGNGYNNKCN